MDKSEGKKGVQPHAFVRNTRQRRVILDVLRSTDTHPTADWIYQRVRERVPNVSLGTVYRNLRTLAQSGEVLELNYGSTFSRFDGRATPHYHFVCERCHRVLDVLELPVQSELEREVERRTGFRVHGHRLEFYGICRECRQAERSGAVSVEAGKNEKNGQAEAFHEEQ
ncbi:MAG: transcriptional repressor [Limnochordaceae bacterium]|nr:transcriptional repressor [Limnochordaceae bacterium]